MDKVFKEAVKHAYYEWAWDKRSPEEDVISELWVWYLESPATQGKLGDVAHHDAVNLVKDKALQIMSGMVLHSNRFDGRNLYSIEAVRKALSGTSTNRYIKHIMPTAMANLERKNAGHAEAIRSRYTDGITPPKEGGQAMVLSRAVQSLADQLNIIVIEATTDSGGNRVKRPGKGAVQAHTRRVEGYWHSDPTADTAIALMSDGASREERLVSKVIRGGRISPEQRADGHYVLGDETTSIRDEFYDG